MTNYSTILQKRMSYCPLKKSGISLKSYFDASVYLAPGAAGKHLNAALFESAGIELRRVDPRSPVYPQLWGDFIPDLSTFDLLFNCGPKAHEILLA